ncbi:MAG: septum formation initiator [Campylobacteraceae bacterium]|jgi:hypothetical protein|nr:septum formation initiator [Campylobacteraceae bacterium]
MKEDVQQYKTNNVTKIVIIAVLCFVVISVQLGNILYGENSEILDFRKEEKNRLEFAISILKKENAALQKEYFELRELDPDTRRNR